MKQTLIDIWNRDEVLIDFHPYPDTEIYEYIDAITEMSREIKRVTGSAYMALDAIDALNDIPEEVE